MIDFTSLPIVQRELLVSSRKRLTFWSRIIAALGGFLAVVLIVGIEPDLMTAGALGAKLFRCLALPAFIVCLFGGALLTADCLSVEKREGTLGLLFLTNLKGYDVVFGKFVAKSLTGVYCLLAIFPMLAVPILLGGVTGPDFWRVVLVLLNTAFLSLSVGMVVSVLCRDTRNVFAVSLFILFLISITPSLAHIASPRTRSQLPGLFSPVACFISALPSPFPIRAHLYSSIFILHLFGWLCLAIASLKVKTSWQERRKVEIALPSWRERVRGSASVRLALRRRLLPINPMLWLESRDQVLRIGLTVLVLGVAIGCWFLNDGRGFPWRDPGSAVIPIFFLHFILTLLLALDASSRLLIARREGMLTVVLATRMTVPEILRGEFLALRRLFGGPLIVVLTYHVIWFLNVIHHAPPSRTGLVFIIAAGLALVLVANCYSLVCVALFEGLHARRAGLAAVKSFALVILIPCSLTAVAVLAIPRNFLAGFAIFIAINWINAWVFGRGAYDRLKQEFRESLTEHRAPVKVDFNEDYALLK